MRSICLRITLLSAAFAILISIPAAHAQTDVGLSFYGAFGGTTNANGTIQSPANSAGGMIEVRHISNPIVGYEATYSYNRDNQTYRPAAGVATCPVGVTCGQPVSVSASAHEISGDWIASVHLAMLRPFALAGVGVLFNQPSGSQPNTNSETKPTFIYGAGLDWAVFPHIGLRFQYRGNLYKAPDLTKLYTSTDAFTHTSEPMIGAYIRF